MMDLSLEAFGARDEARRGREKALVGRDDALCVEEGRRLRREDALWCEIVGPT